MITGKLIESPDFCVRDLFPNLTQIEVERALIEICQMTERMIERRFPNQHIGFRYLNIPEATQNPDGNLAFFRMTTLPKNGPENGGITYEPIPYDPQ